MKVENMKLQSSIPCSFELNEHEIDNVSGGFVCGGLCIAAGVVAAAGLLATGIQIGEAMHDASRSHADHA